jgi:hypothetical protein
MRENLKATSRTGSANWPSAILAMREFSKMGYCKDRQRSLTAAETK